MKQHIETMIWGIRPTASKSVTRKIQKKLLQSVNINVLNWKWNEIYPMNIQKQVAITGIGEKSSDGVHPRLQSLVGLMKLAQQ